MEYGAQVIAPESIIAQARKVKMNRKEKEISTEKAKELQPGDLILIKTPSAVYDLFRQIGSHSYDHIIYCKAVVIDEERSLHISYPRTKLVPTILFTDQKKSPLIIRPNFNQEEREAFAKNMHKQIGKGYDYKRVVKHLINTTLGEVTQVEDNPNKIVCSHQIFKSLLEVVPQLSEAVDNLKDLEYHKYGTFTLEDFRTLAKGNRDKFKTFQLYTSPGTKTPKFFSVENMIQYIPPDKIVPLFKVYKMVQKYKFLKTLAKTSTAIAFQVAFLRKQIILLLTLYKMYQLLKDAKSEYKHFFGEEKGAKTRLEQIQSVITNILAMASILESKKGIDFNKLMVPISRLMLMTKFKTRSDIKARVLKMAAFMSSMSQKVKDRFKL